MLYLISYDARHPEATLDALDRRIRELGGVRVLETQWLIEPPGTLRATALWKELRRITSPNDGLLVAELTQQIVWGTHGMLVPDQEMERLRSCARSRQSQVQQ